MNLKQLINLILDHPELSNARIGRLSRSSTRTVYRYRKLLEDVSLSAAERSDEAWLRAKFNRPRHVPAGKTPIDWSQTRAVLCTPNVTVRDAWEQYRASRPQPHVGYSRFRRQVRARFGKVYIVSSPGSGGDGSANGSWS